MEKNGRRQSIQIWNSKGAELKPITAGIGVYLLQHHLALGEFGDCSAAILDLRKGKLFVADAIPRQIPAMVSSEFAWVDIFFHEAAKAA